MAPPSPSRYVAVVGPGSCSEAEASLAAVVGAELARAGAALVCGGLGGVMEAACRGCAEAGGLTIGILPGADRSAANPWVRVAIATGMGELRNGLLVRTADALIAVGGAYGTLSEIALALKAGKPVVGLGTWRLPEALPAGAEGLPGPGIVAAVDAVDAVRRALAGVAR